MSSTRAEDIIEAADTLRKNRSSKPPVKPTLVRYATVASYHAAVRNRLAATRVEEVIAMFACEPPHEGGRKRLEGIADQVSRINAAAEADLVKLPERRAELADQLRQLSNSVSQSPDFAQSMDKLRNTRFEQHPFKLHIELALPKRAGKPAPRPP